MLTEIHKKRISESKRGKPAWNKGKPMSEAQKKKLSETQKGKKFSKTHKKKISEANRGRKLSKEHIEKLRANGKNRKGYKHSEKTKKKISEAHKGSRSHFWKGGITPENLKIRMSVEYRLWCEAVFARDNWTCQKTEIVGGNLEAHHIKPFAQFPELRFAIDNGITLSEKAHKQFHKECGRKNNTKEQLQKFIN